MARRCLAIMATAIVLFAVSVVFAGTTGQLKVSLVDKNGVTINGVVTAKLGSTVKTCNTDGGTCTLTGLKAGTWVVTAKTSGGAKGGPYNKTVKVGTTVNLTVKVVTSTTQSSRVVK